MNGSTQTKPVGSLLAIISIFFAVHAVANDRVTIIYDDSQSMCAYLPGKSTERTGLTEVFAALRLMRESLPETIALRGLDDTDVETKHVPVQLGALSSAVRKATKRSECAVFPKSAGKLSRAIPTSRTPVVAGKKPYSSLTIFVTDGVPSGDERKAFVENFDKWQKSYKEPARGKLSAGVLGFKSRFEGKYYYESSPSLGSLKLPETKRPLYVFWFADNVELAKRWMNELETKLKSAGNILDTPGKMTFLPVPYAKKWNFEEATTHFDSELKLPLQIRTLAAPGNCVKHSKASRDADSLSVTVEINVSSPCDGDYLSFRNKDDRIALSIQNSGKHAFEYAFYDSKLQGVALASEPSGFCKKPPTDGSVTVCFTPAIRDLQRSVGSKVVEHVKNIVVKRAVQKQDFGNAMFSVSREPADVNDKDALNKTWGFGDLADALARRTIPTLEEHILNPRKFSGHDVYGRITITLVLR